MNAHRSVRWVVFGLIPKLSIVDAHTPETLAPGDRRKLSLRLA